MSEWARAFRRFELIAGVWPREQSRLLRDAVFASVPVERFVDRLVPRARAVFTPELSAQIDGLRPVFHRAWERFGIPDPGVMEDVYHAAIYLLWSDWTGMHWFRGHRRAEWPFTASLYRRHSTIAEFEAALGRVASFCEYVGREYPAPLSEIQRVAIAQHYGVETWLLDATRSPWIALYFASTAGEDGDVGIVRQIDPHYWRDLGTGVVEINVPGVRRIERQQAVFLSSPHPDLFDQYVGLELRFHQRERQVFESTLLDVGDDLLRADDPIVNVVEAWRSERPAPPGTLWEPPKRRSLSPLTAEDYFEGVLLPRLALDRELNPEKEAALRLICRLHAEVQTRKREVPPFRRSLNHFWTAVSFVLAASDPFFDEGYWIHERYAASFPAGYVASLANVLR